MAVDNHLARKNSLNRPVLRFYSWQPNAISVGFHQKTDEIDGNKCHRDGIDIVRRPTGGRAILHAEEVTYSLVFPKSHSEYHTSALDIYNRVSQALVSGLTQLGFPAAFSPRPHVEKSGKYQQEFACFATSTQYEVTCQQRKLVGSAQRRFKSAVMQHGSILTGDKHLRLAEYVRYRDAESKAVSRDILRKNTICLSDILDHVPGYDQIVTALADGFRDVFKCELEHCNLTDIGLKNQSNQLQSKSTPNL
jgi:lipoate-protein ligase A